MQHTTQTAIVRRQEIIHFKEPAQKAKTLDFSLTSSY